ncbi:MAG: phosphoribosylanthranilate isomerase [Planctomycetaceae bacterium]|nr:phosphoribosylanthranilate isomerase [Planctomycetaceae bacterium]
MFRVKICGVTNCEDAAAVVASGADAIGLNFYPRSPRFIDEERAAEIVRLLPSSICKVGVFVNADPVEVCLAFDRLKLDLIQLHGDEPPGYLTELGGRPTMRAFRGLTSGLSAINDYLSLCLSAVNRPRMILLDAPASAGQYGGTGQVVDWHQAARHVEIATLPPLVLAGGLVPGNVAEAIRTVRPHAVDTASGVESSPGRKDAKVIDAFVKVSRETLGQLA